MKKIVNYIGLVFLSLFVSTVVFYIIGAFGAANFNIKDWSIDGRIFVSIGIVIGTVVCSIISIAFFIEEEKKGKYMVYPTNINTKDVK